MISTRLVAAIVGAVLVAGILVGAAGAVLFAPSRKSVGSWGPGHPGMMAGGGYRMMDGSWSYGEMRDEMREHMGWAPGAADESPSASPSANR